MGDLVRGVNGHLGDISFLSQRCAQIARNTSAALRLHGLARWKTVSPRSYEAMRRQFGRPASVQQPADELPPFGSTVDVDGITMRIDDRMSPHNIKKLVRGGHTAHERRLLHEVLEANDTVMELGGGIGMVAITCAKKIGSDKVFSYEANPRLESLIRDNYGLNNVNPTLKMCILGERAGTQTFYLAARFSRSSTYNSEADSERIEVPVEPFNDEIRRIRPTVLVVDIQGGEAELFGYADLQSVKKLLFEVHPDIIGTLCTINIRRHLRRMGFEEKSKSGYSFLFVRH